MVNSYKKCLHFPAGCWKNAIAIRGVNLERFCVISRSIREDLDRFRSIREDLNRHSIDINASTTAKFVHLNRDTVNKIFSEIRQIIAKYCELIFVFSRIERADDLLSLPVPHGKDTNLDTIIEIKISIKYCPKLTKKL